MFEIISAIEKKIQERIDFLGLPGQNATSASALINLIELLDGKDVELNSIPLRAAQTLAYMSVASPGVCLLRILRNCILPSAATEDFIYDNAREMADAIISQFDRREGSAAVELTTPKNLNYYEQVLYYCAMGNLQSVLDEYCHMISENGDAAEIIEAFNNSFVSATPYRIPTTFTYCRKGVSGAPMRRFFAFDYAKIVADKNIKHNGTLQQAFNSPFRPFVLSTTSIGQEGLDFHFYARKIVHWNLPSNPVDLEQREGRINRYKCLAIRRNIAKFFGDRITWNEMFAEADRVWHNDTQYSEMVPYWCLPKEIISKYDDQLEHIERIVPMYPMSVDEIRYDHLIKVLSLYRLTMGQPRQEELLQLLEGKVSEEQMKDLLFDLSPYSRNHKNAFY